LYALLLANKMYQPYKVPKRHMRITDISVNVPYLSTLVAKIGNLFHWIYGHLTGKATNFNWVVKDKLAGSAIATSFREIIWLDDVHGIRIIVTIKEKPLPSKWFESGKIGYFHFKEEYDAPSVQELHHVVNYLRSQIDNGKPVLVHCGR
jgi:atypical dual specificity phosphatase